MAMLSRWFTTIVVTAALAPSVGRGEVAGKWVAELTSPTLLEPAYIRVVLERTGDAVSGVWGTEIVKGTVKGSTVSKARERLLDRAVVEIFVETELVLRAERVVQTQSGLQRRLTEHRHGLVQPAPDIR